MAAAGIGQWAKRRSFQRWRMRQGRAGRGYGRWEVTFSADLEMVGMASFYSDWAFMLIGQ